MIGISLSFCVRDICAGKVRFADVEKIVAGTAATPDRWQSLMEQYSETYWRKNPERCQRIANALYRAGRVEQPRLTIGKAPVLASASGDTAITYWVEREEDIRLMEV